ncbi:MAG TPA: alpha/beta fold hydrolase [Anaerolineae bacterium]|nr:alpha/beta fold hydrolase [Anaerolineae bacterium]
MSSGGPEAVIIQSAGKELLGALYLGSGAGPRPTAIVLHGIPGIERNFDIAYALRDAGWNALIFHYRGSWGSTGEYTLSGIPDDVRAAIDELISGTYAVDADRFALIGHSLGGWAAIVCAARDPRVKAAVTISGISNMRTWYLSPEQAMEYARFMSGASGTQLQSEIRALGTTRNPVDVIADIRSMPILIVHSNPDDVVNIDQAYGLHKASNGAADLVIIDGADHTFSRHRRQLVETVGGWLARKL